MRHPVPIGRELGSSRRKKMVVHFWGRSHVKLDSIKNWELGKGGSRKFRSDMNNGAKVFLKSYSLFLFESLESRVTKIFLLSNIKIICHFSIANDLFVWRIRFYSTIPFKIWRKKITRLCSWDIFSKKLGYAIKYDFIKVLIPLCLGC